jgi:ammonium transporter Rh
MVHIQNATLAGGVAVGTIADMSIEPYGAMLIGCTAGVISTLGFEYLTPILKKYKLHDTCGVNNLHGMPGVLSGIVGSIVAMVATREKYATYHDKNRLYTFYQSMTPVYNSTDYNKFQLNLTSYQNGDAGRTANVQGWFQFAALIMTLFVAIVTGLLTGFIMKAPIFNQISEAAEQFEDQSTWKIPENDDNEYNSLQTQSFL